MPLIYIKLKNASSFYDQRLNFRLNAQKPAGVLDYSNINDNIIEGLNANQIEQISEADYYAINPPTPDTPIVVNPTELSVVQEYLEPCPVDGVVLFGFYANKWYKILWSTVKQCVGGGGSGPSGSLMFRVNEGAPPEDKPGQDDTSFVNEFFEGTTPDGLFITLNGVEIPHESLVGSEEINYYSINPDNDTPGKLVVVTPFNVGDRFAARKIGNAKRHIALRVGDGANEDWAPEDGDGEFEHPIFAGKDKNQLLVMLDGVELYHKDLFDPSEYADYNWYIIDPDSDNPNLFKVNVLFATNNRLTVTELL